MMGDLIFESMYICVCIYIYVGRGGRERERNSWVNQVYGYLWIVLYSSVCHFDGYVLTKFADTRIGV